jgi:hypothetical protein
MKKQYKPMMEDQSSVCTGHVESDEQKIMDGEYVRISKEMVTNYFKVLFWRSPAGSEETTESCSHNVWDSNHILKVTTTPTSGVHTN